MAPRPSPSPSAYWRLLGFVRPHRAVAAAGLLAALGAAVATSLYAWLAGPLLRAVLTDAPVEVAGLRLDGARMLRVLPALLVGVALLKAVSQYLQGGLMQRLAQGVMRDLREALHARLLAQPPAFFEGRHSGEVLARFTQDVPAVEFSVSQALTSYVKDGLQVLALLVTCLLIDVKLFVVGFVLLPALVVPLARFRKGIKKHVNRTQGSLGALTQLAAEQLQSLAVVQAYRGEARAMEAFDAEAARYMRAMQRSLFLRGAFSPLFEFVGLAGVALVIAFGARAVGADPPLAGRILSFVAATMLLWAPLKGLTNTGTQVMVGLVAAERLFTLVDAPVAPEPARRAGPLREGLVLEGVRAVYPDGREALRGLDVRVPAGRRVALVGASGAGKTSVFSVLLGFLPVSGGRVAWDGVDLAELAASSVRAQVAWVPQEPVLFTGSVRHNLLLGRPEASDAELWDALGHAHADAFVRALPGGLDAFVGERGATLSGGQRQRLALARAFLRQPSVLLLDEPTSALDAESEAAVSAGLAALMQGRTVLVIAHRLSTVRDADLIVVMDAGRVVEAGTHAELVARGGRYAALLGAGDVVAA